MNFLIVPGHYGTVGARGNGYREEDLTKVIATKVTNELLYQGHSVTLAEFNLYDRLSRGASVNELLGYDYIMEIHLNAGGGVGSEIFVPVGTKGKSVELAIMHRLGKYFTLRAGTGVKEGDYYILTKLKDRPIALLEVCFIDSAEDMRILMDNLDAICVDMAHGILEGFEEPIKIRPAQPAPVVKVLDPAQEWTVKNMIFKDEAWDKPLTKSQMAWALYTIKKRGI